MAKLSDEEIIQLNKLSKIVHDIIESKEYDFQIDQKIKIDTTPKNDRIKLIKEELKKIQNHALEFNDEIKDHFAYTVEEFRQYEHFEELNKKGKAGIEIYLEMFGDYPKTWMKSIVNNFALEQDGENESFPYLTFNYDSIDRDDIYELIDDPEKHINLPYFNDLIDCLSTLNEFHSWSEFYRILLDEKTISIKRKNNNIVFDGDLSVNQYKYLYKALINNDSYIDEFRTSESDFINVFTKEFDSHESKIYILNETVQASYLFHKLRIYFTDFFKNIEHSKMFITKDGTILKSNNISSQLSKTVKKGIPVKNQFVIDEIVNNIPEKG